MRRCTPHTRLAAWTVTPADPTAPVIATTTPSTAVAATTDQPTAALRTTAVAADPATYAQLLISTWLHSSADEATNAQARRVQSTGPDLELPDPAADPPPPAEHRARRVTRRPHHPCGRKQQVLPFHDPLPQRTARQAGEGGIQGGRPLGVVGRVPVDRDGRAAGGLEEAASLLRLPEHLSPDRPAAPLDIGDAVAAQRTHMRLLPPQRRLRSGGGGANGFIVANI
ncbi:putative secreted protein [Streptomyces davaonensis JCM 4913]|uniref:Putative secreted protein n=1 Tax=Streptomyces davaonensis (strain DSM 101723 / JCM 4913 / KCC S-0913 / 768) TaxID=1214101 RepID=K4QUQ3_STRDJ|nr:hypothetical protein [Streptomyces davaonensis]CCK24500.1 putative secreted protein [Streptomyces davaonensis JCM 4913]